MSRSCRAVALTSAALAIAALAAGSAQASGGPGGGGAGGGGTTGAPCARIDNFSAQGQNSLGGILEKDVIENCGTVPLTVEYHLMWNADRGGVAGVDDRSVTLAPGAKLNDQQLITDITPFNTYVVELDLLDPATGSFYDIKSAFTGLFPRI